MLPFATEMLFRREARLLSHHAVAIHRPFYSVSKFGRHVPDYEKSVLSATTRTPILCLDQVTSDFCSFVLLGYSCSTASRSQKQHL